MEESDGTTGQRLEYDHHVIDEGFRRFAESLAGVVIDRASFEEAAEGLRHHIYVEEVLHFPVLRAAGMLAPILVMLREHGEIWDLLDGTTAALDRDDRAAVLELWPTFTSVLEQHNVKEERIIYPAGDTTLTAEEADRITAALDSGDRPAGWRCEMSSHISVESPEERNPT